MDTDTNRTPARRWRRSHSLQLWLIAAALLALAGLVKVEAGSHGARHGIATAEAHAGVPVAARLDAAALVILPEEYRAIRAAGVDGATPAIPPSETWPAQ
jgi:hypothetical protein